MSTINVNVNDTASIDPNTSKTMSTVRDIVGEPNEKHTDAKREEVEEVEEVEESEEGEEREEGEESEADDDDNDAEPQVKKTKRMQVKAIIEMDLIKTRDELLQEKADLYKDKDRLRDKWMNIGLWKERLANKESAQLKLTDELWKREQKIIRDEKRLETQKREFRNLVASVQHLVNMVDVSEDEQHQVQHVSTTSTTPAQQQQFPPQQNQWRPRFQPCYRPPYRQVIKPQCQSNPPKKWPYTDVLDVILPDKKYNKYLKNRRNEERRYNNKH